MQQNETDDSAAAGGSGPSGNGAPPQEPLNAGDATSSGAVPSLAELLDQAAAFLRRYILFASDAQVVAVTLWIAHAYVFDVFDVTPYLAVTSAEKGSGKTRLLELLEQLVARAWRTVAPTEAVLFRKISRDRPTLLLDEADAIFHRVRGVMTPVAEALRSLLNAGYRRGALVERCNKDSKGGVTLEAFSVYCPKAIAAIGELPGTITDRSIPVVLHRRPHGATGPRFRYRDVQAETAPLRAALAEWATAVVSQLCDARPDVPVALNDRAADGWEPLLAIADLAGGDWSGRARAAALELHAERDEDSVGIQLLRAIREIFKERCFEEQNGLFTADLLNALAARDDEPWNEELRIPAHVTAADTVNEEVYRRLYSGSAARLAKMLRPYGANSRTLRVGDRTAKGYVLADFRNAFAAYLGEQATQTEGREGV